MNAIAIAVVSGVAFVSGIGAATAAEFPMTPRQIIAYHDGHSDFDIGVDLRLPPINGLIPVVDSDLYAVRCDQVKAEANPDLQRLEMFCGPGSLASGN